MKAGELDRKITIQEESVARDSFGAEIVSWVDVATNIWAAAWPLRGDEKRIAKQINAEAKTQFRIRYRAGIDTKMRIVFNGGNYDIIEVTEFGRRQGLKIISNANV